MKTTMPEVLVDDPYFSRAVSFFEALQDEIVAALEASDGAGRFLRDDWQREPVESPDPQAPILTGYGRTRVLEGGRVLERGGVNVSVVEGRFQQDFAGTMPGEGRHFRASGISLVLHPLNPHAPTVHLNYRRLQRGGAAWFGGGADLTPSTLYEEDARHFHGHLRAACLRHPEVARYAELKEACDRYFYLPHRKEHRGIGGLFFDHWLDAPEASFAFVQDVGRAFLDAYLPILERRKDQPFTEEERAWQLVRRGRYVEFNLIWDRGTLFGLRTGGRIESILMSMPATASWAYDARPPGPAEAALLDAVRQPRVWV